MTKFTEAVGAPDVRLAVWLEALTKHAGNITHAAEEFGFSRQRGFSLTKRHGLMDEAKRLRVEAGQSSVGRPKKLPK